MVVQGWFVVCDRFQDNWRNFARTLLEIQIDGNSRICSWLTSNDDLMKT